MEECMINATERKTNNTEMYIYKYFNYDINILKCN